ncbi:sensor histidine kinase [Peribacillus simplex]|uniref:sensor histidine kinase n=1 Tax=Peribacillus simplex TaxID=1478 RepID=UPI0010BE6706|nr:sensor histidine kinase [Peribacillus simplex]TKH07516.1 sensor histidine kinase [Peribacillus simplex]
MRSLKEHNKLVQNITDDVLVSRIPITLWIILVYAVTILLQYIEKPYFLKSLIFTVIIAIHIILHWFTNSWANKGNWYYFVVQGGLIYISAFLMPNSSPAVLIGLLPILIAQSITVFYNIYKVLSVFIPFYILYCFAIGINYGSSELPIFISIFLFIMTIVISYSIFYNRQVNARIRIKNYLDELEFAHKKVEELTLANERQRMARDLHDTLAQGLAGLIMQLEAVDAHLLNGNTKRSQEIVQQSMQQARRTLAEARQAIDDLRSNSLFETDFASAVKKEIKGFNEATSIKVISDIGPIPPLSSLTMEHSLYIIKECLINIAKHAQAENVNIKIKEKADMLFIEIKDNGRGFKANSIGKQPGHYGLLGLNERVRLIGGTIQITSENLKGTRVYIKAPI